MEDFANFSSDLFDAVDLSKRDAKVEEFESPSSFQPEMKTPGWFFASDSSPFQTKPFNLWRMRGAFSYWKKDWLQAKECYALAVKSAPSNICRLEALDSLARCWLELGDWEEANRLAGELANLITNGDQQISLWTLRLKIHKFQEPNSGRRFFILLLAKNDVHADFWSELADCDWTELCKFCRPLTVAACLIRSLFLLKSVEISALGFSLELNQASQTRIQKQLELLAVEEGAMTECRKIMCKDIRSSVGCQTTEFTYRSEIFTDPSRKWNELEEAAAASEFVLKWFGWIWESCSECRRFLTEFTDAKI